MGPPFSVFQFVIVILVIVFGFKLLNGVLERRHDARRSRYTDQERTEALERLAELEERVRVLERIVTDDPNDLRRQFRALND